MKTLTTVDRDEPIDELLAHLHRDGGVIVRDLLSDEGRLAIIEDLAGAMEVIEPGSRSGLEQWELFHGRETIRFCGLAGRSRAFVDPALLEPVFGAVTDHELLGQLFEPAEASTSFETGTVKTPTIAQVFAP